MNKPPCLDCIHSAVFALTLPGPTPLQKEPQLQLFGRCLCQPFVLTLAGVHALACSCAGGMRQLHWHPTCDEWQFVINVSAGRKRHGDPTAWLAVPAGTFPCRYGCCFCTEGLVGC
jgi:hypothetical protein